ncbi:MAG: DUF6485 family protein [Oscillospiraceae bacterium]|nr:DUF6485 family protein [Oscillospiraceae bacterium]
MSSQCVKDCCCPRTACKNHGRCCDCVAKHRGEGTMPFCMFPENEGDYSYEGFYRYLHKRFGEQDALRSTNS